MFQIELLAIDAFFTALRDRTDDYYGNGSFLGFWNRMKNLLLDFKIEVQSNIFILSKDKNDAFLDLMEEKMNSFGDFFLIRKVDITQYYKKYNTTENKILSNSDDRNKLYWILNNEISTLKEVLREQGSSEYDSTIHLLRDFYMFYSNYYLTEAKKIVEAHKNTSTYVAETTLISKPLELSEENVVEPCDNTPEQNALAIFEVCFKKYRNRIVVNPREYSRLLEYVSSLIDNRKLPETIEEIPETPLPDKHLIYCFNLMRRQLYRREGSELFAKFLHTTFKQLQGTSISTIKSKINSKPDTFFNDFPELRKFC